MEYVLTTDRLTKRYGQFKSLNELSIHIPKGSIYGLVGKNGAGKTTLIRVVCGLQRPTDGSYSIYGIPDTNRAIARARRRMGAVVETPAIYHNMSAADNLKQQCLSMGIPSFDAIPELLHLVELADTGRKRAGNFSLGMKQRLGIAMALVGNPDFLILDEPVNGLDPEGIIELRELILRLNREGQITVLISSHILDELSRLATHYGFIDGGRLVKEITAAELEKECRKCICVEVSDTKALVYALDQDKVEYEIVSDRVARIYGDVHLSALARALDRVNCDLISAREQDESLETYFINLLGGKHHV